MIAGVSMLALAEVRVLLSALEFCEDAVTLHFAAGEVNFDASFGGEYCAVPVL